MKSTIQVYSGNLSTMPWRYSSQHPSQEPDHNVFDLLKGNQSRTTASLGYGYKPIPHEHRFHPHQHLSAPKIARATSVRPAPIKPANPKISPFFKSKLTSLKSLSRLRVRHQEQLLDPYYQAHPVNPHRSCAQPSG